MDNSIKYYGITLCLVEQTPYEKSQSCCHGCFFNNPDIMICKPCSDNIVYKENKKLRKLKIKKILNG